MTAHGAPHRVWTALFAGLIAASAYLGAAAMISGLLRLEPVMVSRIPLHSPVFAGLALACVVALPNTAVAVFAWRGHPRSADAATLAGLLLVGWIAVELAVVREASFLQGAYALAGIGLIILGGRRMLLEVADVLVAVPLFLTAPLYRRWHLQWGATPAEVSGPMPGDELVPVSHFTATRAITINAAPEAVWPWIAQVGYRRAGFYSYDLLDNLGRPSAATVLPEWQHVHVGDVAAPMTAPPTPETSFVVTEIAPPGCVVWSKVDSSWAWRLTPLGDGTTRLVTRLKQRYRPTPSALLTVILAEFGDFAMMRRMLLGIRQRAERG